jgi:hypothetical protein
MWSAISARLAEAIVGLLIAGVVMALLVPVVGSIASPGLAAAVGVICIAGVMWVAHRLRRRSRSPAPRL